MSRYNRDFTLTVEADGLQISIEPPFRVSFDAVKSVAGGLNKATIKVYNLVERKRLALTKDTEQVKRIPVSLAVGYNGSKEVIFKGTLQRGSNSREGADIVTLLYCLDGGYDFQNSFISTTSLSAPVDDILSELPNTQKGKISDIQKLIRPKVLVGDASRLLGSIISDDQSWYIDNEKLYILSYDEVVSSFVPVVSADTGMLNTPEREQSKVTFDTLMNPALKIGGLCQVKSKTAQHLNGIYRLEAISYSGDNYGNDWQQKCTGLLQTNYKVL